MERPTPIIRNRNDSSRFLTPSLWLACISHQLSAAGAETR